MLPNHHGKTIELYTKNAKHLIEDTNTLLRRCIDVFVYHYICCLISDLFIIVCFRTRNGASLHRLKSFNLLELCRHLMQTYTTCIRLFTWSLVLETKFVCTLMCTVHGLHVSHTCMHVSSIQFNSKTVFKDGDPVSLQLIFHGAIQTCEQYNILHTYIQNNTGSSVKHRLLDSLVLTSSARGPGFNPQSRTASYQRRNKNGRVVPLFGTQH